MAEKYLGKLCKYGHDHEGSGKSLRYGSPTGSCVACKALQAPAWAAANPDKKRESGRRTDAKRASEKRAYNKQWREDNLEYRKEYERRYGQENKERLAKYARERRQNDEGLRITNCMRVRIAQLLRDRNWLKEPGLTCAVRAQVAKILAVHGPCPHEGWHLCHREPVCSFDATAPDFLEKCWHVDNVFWGSPEENYETIVEDRKKSIRRLDGTPNDAGE